MYPIDAIKVCITCNSVFKAASSIAISTYLLIARRHECKSSIRPRQQHILAFSAAPIK
jgi:hypothetical protein